ncbi:MAG: 3-isopropylmalate dehydrogenase [Armatimonadetes bacterium]|nr:3-isopropylmalate dehydrogenase [Armatimonadota bacterium]MDW8029363.1 3-isopropylmalate dehydrogenase [Armatimonadota bacterium]
MTQKSYKIAVIPGDGIGIEVVAEGLKVLEAACKAEGVSYETVQFDIGGERYLRTGETLPESILEELKGFDAIYFGAIGHPDVPPGVLERGVLLKIRFALDLFVNLRPVKLYRGVECPLKDKTPDDIDFIVVRENTEDVYALDGTAFQPNTDNEVAIQPAIYTRKGTERIIRFAFELAHKRAVDKNKSLKVTLVDKANVMTVGHGLWRRVFEEVAKEFPEVETEALYVDAAAMEFLLHPERFQVVVTTNLFGDILTDLGAAIQGGIGIAPSGNINPGKVSMFEPVHGSAPTIAGKGLACPLAAILTAAMMMEHLGETKVAQRIESAVEKALQTGKIRSLEAGKMGLSTKEVGNLVASFV